MIQKVCVSKNNQSNENVCTEGLNPQLRQRVDICIDTGVTRFLIWKGFRGD